MVEAGLNDNGDGDVDGEEGATDGGNGECFLLDVLIGCRESRECRETTKEVKERGVGQITYALTR